MNLATSASVRVCIFLVFSMLFINLVRCEEDVITDEEKELVARFRPLVSKFLYKDYMNTDAWLVRFLRVRNYDVTRASDLLKEVITWRKKEKMDTILAEDFGAVEKLYPLVFEGVDNYDRPLLLGNVGVINLRKIVISGQGDFFMRFVQAALELVEAVAREVQAEPGRENVTRAYLVLDLAGFNLRQHWCGQCIQFIPTLLRTLESYYPDRVYRIVSVNTPRVFVPIFELVRPFLSSPLQKSIRVLDYDVENWKKFLRSEIPDDQLPIQYGGTRKVQPKTFSYLKRHDKYIKAAVEKAELELEALKQKEKDATAKPETEDDGTIAIATAADQEKS